MIAVYNPDYYSNILEAIESGGLYYTASFVEDNYTAIADMYEVIIAMENCLGTEVSVFFTEDKRNFVPIQEKLDSFDV
jgi:hypothetical protein